MRFIACALCVIFFLQITACHQPNKNNQQTDNADTITDNTANKNSIKPVVRDQLKTVEMLQKGMLLVNVRKYSVSLKFFDSAIARDPNNTSAYAGRAAAYFGMGQYDDAKADCDIAYNLNHDNYNALYTRSLIEINSNNFTDAITDLNNVINLKPEYAEAYSYRGMAEGASGNLPMAEADFNRAIKINPKLAIAYYNRGVMYGLEKKTDKEMSDYKKALKLNPNYAEALLNIAVIKEKNYQDYRGAITDLNRVIKLDPKNAKAFFDRGKCQHALKKYMDAIDDYTAAIKLFPNYKTAYAFRSQAYKAIGNNEAAQKDMATANSIK